MFLQRVQQRAGTPEDTLHKLFLVLRAVHASKVKNEISLITSLIQLLGSRIQVVLKDSFNTHVTVATSLAVLDVIELSTEVPSHEPLCSSNKYLH